MKYDAQTKSDINSRTETITKTDATELNPLHVFDTTTMKSRHSAR